MPKGELFKELGAPISNLAAGPRELHNFSDERKVEVLNGRVAAFSGFPQESIIEVKQPAQKRQQPTLAREQKPKGAPSLTTSMRSRTRLK